MYGMLLGDLGFEKKKIVEQGKGVQGMINEGIINCGFKQVRWDERFEGVQEVSYVDCGKVFWVEMIVKIKVYGWNVFGVFICFGVV